MTKVDADKLRQAVNTFRDLACAYCSHRSDGCHSCFEKLINEVEKDEVRLQDLR